MSQTLLFGGQASPEAPVASLAPQVDGEEGLSIATAEDIDRGKVVILRVARGGKGGPGLRLRPARARALAAALSMAAGRLGGGT